MECVSFRRVCLRFGVGSGAVGTPSFLPSVSWWRFSPLRLQWLGKISCSLFPAEELHAPPAWNVSHFDGCACVLGWAQAPLARHRFSPLCRGGASPPFVCSG